MKKEKIGGKAMYGLDRRLSRKYEGNQVRNHSVHEDEEDEELPAAEVVEEEEPANGRRRKRVARDSDYDSDDSRHAQPAKRARHGENGRRRPTVTRTYGRTRPQPQGEEEEEDEEEEEGREAVDVDDDFEEYEGFEDPDAEVEASQGSQEERYVVGRPLSVYAHVS